MFLPTYCMKVLSGPCHNPWDILGLDELRKMRSPFRAAKVEFAGQSVRHVGSMQRISSRKLSGHHLESLTEYQVVHAQDMIL